MLLVGDSDGVFDESIRVADNAREVPNPDQLDADGDGLGDVIDPDPETPSLGECDLDGDGTIDRSDVDRIFATRRSSSTASSAFRAATPRSAAACARRASSTSRRTPSFRARRCRGLQSSEFRLARIALYGLAPGSANLAFAQVERIGLAAAPLPVTGATGLSILVVPEPVVLANLLLGVAGLAGLGASGRRRREARERS